MPRRRLPRLQSLNPLQTPAERRFDIRHAPRYHSDVEFSEASWQALRFIRWQLGLRTRSQAVNAALVAYAEQLVKRPPLLTSADTADGQLAPTEFEVAGPGCARYVTGTEAVPRIGGTEKSSDDLSSAGPGRTHLPD